MIINDEARQEQVAIDRARDDEKQRAFDYASQVDLLQVRMDNPERNPTEFARQLGRRMKHEDFEKTLRLINPSLTGREHPVHASKRCLYHAQLGFIMAYESGLMPEFSWLTSKEEVHERQIDEKFVLRRADLPKSTWHPHQLNPDGSLAKLGHFEFHGLHPWQEKKTILWNEKLRGWRTVLVRLIFQGLITLSEAEKAFGTSDRFGWAAKVGKREDTLPY